MQTCLTGCSKLLSAPLINVNHGSMYMCQRMFQNCSSLVDVSKITLNAKSLGTGQYQNMFYNCTSLEIPPEIHATTIGSTSLDGMFYGCSKLKELRVHFTEYNDDALSNWVNGVSSTGTFYKLTALPEEFGTNRIPEGWTVVNIDESGSSGGDTDKTYVYTASGFPIDEVNGNYWEDGVYDTGVSHPITGESITFPLYKNLNNCEMYLNADDQIYYSIYIDGEFVYIMGNVTGDAGWQDYNFNEVTEARVKPYEA